MKKAHRQQKKVDVDPIVDIYNNHFAHVENVLSDCMYRSALLYNNVGTHQFAKKWLFYQADMRTNAIFSGTASEYNLNHHARVKDIDFLYKSTTLFNYQRWPFRITNKFYNNVCAKNADILKVISGMSVILNGSFTSKSEFMQTKMITPGLALGPCQAFFYTQTSDFGTLLWEVAIDKVPLIEKNLVSGFEFRHTITFFDYRTDAKIENQLTGIVNSYFHSLKNEPQRQHYGHIEALGTTKYQKGRKMQESYLFAIEHNELGDIYGKIQYGLNDGHTEKWCPNSFQKMYLNTNEQSTLIFEENLQRWVAKDYEAGLEAKRFREYQAQINKELLKRYADFSSAAKLVELLQKIPNFKIKLTDQEKQVVGADGSVMVIGRSGTGKTTCAMLRLFAMEMLFRLRMNLYKLKHQQVLQNTIIAEDSVENQIGLHCVFATASPILTGEVRKYYNKLTHQIKEELEKKKQRDLEKKQQQQQQQQQLATGLEQSQVQILDKEQSRKAEENFFEKQMEGIKLQEEQGGFDSEEDLDDVEKEEEELQKELDKFDSFRKMKDSDFPAFFTIRKLIMLVDGSLTNPFFARNLDSKIIGSESKAQWHAEQQGVMMINKYQYGGRDDDDDQDELQDLNQEEMEEEDIDDYDEEKLEREYQRQMYLMNVDRFKEKFQQKNKFAQEVDYEFFMQNFWPTLTNRSYKTDINGITPHLLWTQIYSHLKGSAHSHRYGGKYVPKSVYISQMGQQIPKPMLDGIFELFIKYERWLIQNHYYDLMDVVNHILVQLRDGRNDMIPIHYLMIDEVQDLPHAILVMLCQITEQGLFFAGDTAQNIAKGVGFRFQDLRSIFNQKDHYETYRFDNVSVHQLTVNFRSHNNILQLANSLVTLLEIYFPRTIDKLDKERSDLDGPKPILVKDKNPESLFCLLSGEEVQQNVQRNAIEFGCNQVIIVKDQATKARVPSILQHALILTIYEAKGLEFDDVILYDFFSGPANSELQWNPLSRVKIEKVLIDKAEFATQITRHKQEQDSNIEIFGFQEKDGKVEVLRLAKDQNYLYGFNALDYSILCNELKQLYVAVTRPRKRLIIYDENPEARAIIESIWVAMDLIQIYDGSKAQGELLGKVAAKTTAAEWRKQGIRMFRNKFYEQAFKCFTLAEEPLLQKKAEAFYLAQSAAQKSTECTANLSSKNTAFKREMQKKIKERNRKFEEAARLFQEIGNTKQAASCYYSAENYLKSLELYLQCGCLKEAGEAAFGAKQFQTAGDCFFKAGDLIRCLDAYEKCEQYEAIFKALQQSTELPLEAKTAYLRKYLPLVLNKLTAEVGQVQSLNYEGQTQKKESQKIIQEEESDEDEDEEEEEEGEEEQEQEQDLRPIEGQQGEKASESQAQVQQTKPPIIEMENDSQVLTKEQLVALSGSVSLVKQESVDAPSEGSESFQVQKSEQSESFQVEQSRQSESFQFEQSEQSKAEIVFDHLSHYDPDDQWLQTDDKKSIIESIASKQSEHSDFSAFSYAQIQNNPNLQLVKTKGDIFIQDSVMQQIIKYISMFSDEFKFQLQYQRSRQTHLTNIQSEHEQGDYIVDFILDLDLVDLNFIYLVLDILEQFKSFKLCIFVCNRYKLADQLGRYLVSIAATYSPLALSPANVNPIYLSNGQQRNSQIEKGLVASFAVHNVFENINPEFLKLKYGDEKLTTSNSLGLPCYEQMILLGFWKKVTYQLNARLALEVCQVYHDYKNWKFIFLTNRIQRIEKAMAEEKDDTFKQVLQGLLLTSQKKLEQCFSTYINFTLHQDEPKNQEEVDFARVSLQQFYADLQYQLVLNKKMSESHFFRQSTMDSKVVRTPLDKILLPALFELTQKFLQMESQNLNVEVLKQIVSNANGNPLHGLSSLKIFEATYLLLLFNDIIIYSPSSQQWKQDVSTLPDDLYIRLEMTLQKIYGSLYTLRDSDLELQKIYYTVILLYYKVSAPNSEILSGFKNSFLIHRSSSLITNLLEKRSKIQLKATRDSQITLDDFYFADIDLEFILAPRDSIIECIYFRCAKKYNSIVKLRDRSLLQYFNDISDLYRSIIAEIPESDSMIACLAASVNSEYRGLLEPVQLTSTGQMKQQIEGTEAQEDLKRQDMKLTLVRGISEQADMPTSMFLNPWPKNKKGNNQRLKEIEFVRQILTYQSDGLKHLNPTIYTAVVEFGLRFIKKAKSIYIPEKKHKNLLKAILVFNYLGLNNYSLMFIQSDNNLQPYSSYVEFLTCKKHFIIDDALGCYLDYYYAQENVLFLDEKERELQQLLILQMVGLKLQYSPKAQVYLPYEYLSFFPGLKQKDQHEFVWKGKFHPSRSYENLEHLIEIIEKNLSSNECRTNSANLVYLVLVFVLNADFKQLEIAKLVNRIKSFLQRYNINVDDLDQLTLKMIGLSSVEERLKAFEQAKVTEEPLCLLKIENELVAEAETKQAYQECLNEWEGYSEKNQQLKKQVQLIVQKYQGYKKSRLYAFTNHKVENAARIRFVEYDLPRRVHKSPTLSVYQIFSQIRKLLISTLYSMYIDNPLDCHFINYQLQLLKDREGQLRKLLEDFWSKKQPINDYNEQLQKFKEEMSEFEGNLRIWQKNNVKFEQTINRLLERNRKMLALKWINQKAGLKLQKIQKRKKGLKRQQLLEQKRLYIS